MYCSKCGKKVGDEMLFCPFCGEAIVIPEQDEKEEAPDQWDSAHEDKQTTVEEFERLLKQTEVESEEEEKEEKSDADDAAAELLQWDSARRDAVDEWARRDEPATPFEPLNLAETAAEGEDWRAEITKKKESVQPEKQPPKIHHHGDAEPVRLEGTAPKLERERAKGKTVTADRKPARKHANTLVPPKTMNPNDIFMDGKTAAYDAYDDAPADDAEGTFDFDVEDDAGFFMRHLRGLVSLALFVILILLFVIYAFSRSGQYTLARANLAWTTEPYSQIGYRSYQDGDYSQAGLYYERALMREPNNYSFASSAAMAYYEAGNTEKSAAMLKRCIEINPTLLEPYIYLLRLYPDASQRPWDVTQLLQQGYQRTGDTRLNVKG